MAHEQFDNNTGLNNSTGWKKSSKLIRVRAQYRAGLFSKINSHIRNERVGTVLIAYQRGYPEH